jgi:peptidoglycan/LPS O-acetylase OafA/YrhL
VPNDERRDRDHAPSMELAGSARTARVVRVGVRMQQRVPALDGVRGIAIVMVLTFHVTLAFPEHNGWRSVFSCGWMGVDLFFVLSGFLITGVLLDSLGQPGFFKRFYIRRALRIWPAYLTVVTLLTGVAIATVWLQPDDANASRFLGEAPWYWLHSTNLMTARTPSFATTPLGTGHLWSLGVEEQFYLLWPIVVFGLANTPRRAIIVSSILIILAPLARLALLRNGVDPLALYVLMPTRADSLAWGCLLAGVIRAHRPFLRMAWPILAAGGAFGIAVLTYRLGEPYNLSPSFVIAGYSFAGMASAGVVGYAAIAERSRFANSALRVVGKYSYAIYLWHAPVLYALSRISGLSLTAYAALAVAATIAMARVSWVLIERPALSLRELLGGARASAIP